VPSDSEFGATGFSMETMMLTKPVPIDFPVRLGKNLTLIDLSNRETI
jgi:hypothetical protein